MPLKALGEDDIPLGRPLLWNVLDGDGKVLFPHGHVIDNKPLLLQLLKLGLFRSVPQPEREAPGASSTAATDGPITSLSQVQLAPGDLVQLQTLHPTHAERYQVSMIGFYAPVSLLVSAPMQQGKLVFVKEGQQFLVRGFVGMAVVAYKTRVLKSHLSPFPYLHLAYPDSIQSMRIRNSARVAVDLITSVVGADDSQVSARITDLSVGGARMSSTKPFANKGDEVTLSFRINPSGLDVYMTITALVRAISDDESQKGRIITGLEFVNVSEQDRLYLSNMVYQNLLKDTL